MLHAYSAFILFCKKHAKGCVKIFLKFTRRELFYLYFLRENFFLQKKNYQTETHERGVGAKRLLRDSCVFLQQNLAFRKGMDGFGWIINKKLVILFVLCKKRLTLKSMQGSHWQPFKNIKFLKNFVPDSDANQTVSQ